MDVGGLRALVASREPVDAREAASVARFLAELDRLSRPFDEYADPVHATASAIVVGPAGTVLHRHKRLGLWLQPGGHVDPLATGPDHEPAWEEPWDAALREAREETGLDVRHPDDGPRFVHVDAHEGGRGHYHLDLRYLLLAHGVPAPSAGESQDVRWFGWDEALAVADPGLRGILDTLHPLQPGTGDGGG